MACDCVEVMNAKLAEHNTKIIETFGFPRDGSPVYTRLLGEYARLNFPEEQEQEKAA